MAIFSGGPRISQTGGGRGTNPYISLKKLIIWQDFCRKLHENERNWTRGGGGLCPSCPPWIHQWHCFHVSWRPLSSLFYFSLTLKNVRLPEGKEQNGLCASSQYIKLDTSHCILIHYGLIKRDHLPDFFFFKKIIRAICSVYSIHHSITVLIRCKYSKNHIIITESTDKACIHMLPQKPLN